MYQKRTDLATEARELWNESAAEKTVLSGVIAREYMRESCRVTHIQITDEQGAKALHKPVGNYITVELGSLGEQGGFSDAVEAAAAELMPLLAPAEGGHVLVAGLGNRAITPDAIGPAAIGQILVTRHLIDHLPDMFGNLRPVSALSTGVLGTTGMESAEIIRGVVDRTKPAMVILIDALASRSLSRLCTTIQLADTGITPGSGVGNSRAALNRESLGVPVIALGVPTVVEAATLLADLSDEAGLPAPDEELLKGFTGNLIVTPKDIDKNIAEIARVSAFAANRALHPTLTQEEIAAYLA
ncbi:MAG: GPR endopeptidase [Oscillospiraceae bacterium]|jgi:spore protease|nr:GPR endopeptidase [Oscillospiraceae bacterium]